MESNPYCYSKASSLREHFPPTIIPGTVEEESTILMGAVEMYFSGPSAVACMRG